MDARFPWVAVISNDSATATIVTRLLADANCRSRVSPLADWDISPPENIEFTRIVIDPCRFSRGAEWRLIDTRASDHAHEPVPVPVVGAIDNPWRHPALGRQVTSFSEGPGTSIEPARFAAVLRHWVVTE